MKRPCSHCTVRTDERLLTRGFCTECFATEAEELRSDLAMHVELNAVAACRAAGLACLVRPCGNPKCGTCVARRQVGASQTDIETKARYAARRRGGPEFTERDVMELERYFRMDFTPKWERSTFGAMCDRIAAETNKNSEYQTSPMESRCPRLIFQETPVDLPDDDRIGVTRYSLSARVCGKLWLTGRIVTKTKRGAIVWRRFKRAHKHRDAPTPVRVFDTEVGGKLVQVQVFLRPLPPDAYPSWVIRPRPPSPGELSYDEDDLSKHFDRRHAMLRVQRTLAALPRWAYDTLIARYAENESFMRESRAAAVAEDPVQRLQKPTESNRVSRKSLDRLAEVALLTSTLTGLRERRAREGRVEQVRETLEDVTRRAADATASTGERANAIELVSRIRREAEELLTGAQTVYAQHANEQ